ncbi:hypothetical protein IJ135_01900 [Candidatus Saccharibacteria bacterium]|nr:hypothetical protein [Candidatus Saccharibacteria bacterium]
MKNILGRMRALMVAGAVATFGSAILPVAGVHAETLSQGFTLGPMKQQMIIEPGESYEGSFDILNPAANTTDFKYTVEVKPFYVDDDYNTVLDQSASYNEIVDWITIMSPMNGILAPNESAEIEYVIDVPSYAPAGGQYAAIVVTSDPGENTSGQSSVLERHAIAHTIFAEIAGATTRSGEITEVDVPGFLFSGEIKGEATIKNTGNVHGTAKYTLSVTPLFSSEEVYTNAEDPDTHIIVPDRTFYNETSWPDTPGMGLFNVKYMVEFEGVTQEVSKLVIICPIWLLFVIAFIIAFIIIAIVVKIVRSKK